MYFLLSRCIRSRRMTHLFDIGASISVRDIRVLFIMPKYIFFVFVLFFLFLRVHIALVSCVVVCWERRVEGERDFSICCCRKLHVIFRYRLRIDVRIDREEIVQLSTEGTDDCSTLSWLRVCCQWSHGESITIPFLVPHLAVQSTPLQKDQLSSSHNYLEP